MVRIAAGASGFSIMELMVVVIIMGTMAAFAIPAYENSVERTIMLDMIDNMGLIEAANIKYSALSAGGEYWPPDTNTYDLADINDNLNLTIVANGATYTCTGDPEGASPWTYTCTATRASGGFNYSVQQDPSGVSVSGTPPT